MPTKAAGMPITTSKVAVTKAAICGRCAAGHERLGRSGAASSAPSNLRIAASTAASRRAGRGGGGFGSKADMSSSTAIYRFSPICH
jgi:AhpD family alkylhydroperoxidase